MKFGDLKKVKLNEKFFVEYSDEVDFITLIELQDNTNLTDKAMGLLEAPMEIYASTYTVTGTAKATSYSWVGMKIWTVTTNYEFQYTEGVSVSHITHTGYFNPSILSLWKSSPWMDNYMSGGKAVASTYGTANLNFTLAQILGLDFNLQTVNYNLKVYSDNYGNISATYTAAKP